ncbi:UDP-N-acetylglucosamine 2-epimerase [Fulvivirga lutea]|uniref:UDP-N-acetylglucosamine 2-epimerase (Hydrolyzing) n=1 Tax=Fulvivirga lutea TaxID=2810512 RepID=A0A974WFW6_9BACT|nr:UDP-N-acetylglucosamine 2-epimerase [Fulvivirga lutea]QSE96818.1 UDP-N-acetylglucosamine 2-epimerase (hydrolyzing) [Fulvivirga lutea]
MKIGILTSSRADYGIYMPLLNALKKDNSIHLEIIAFGTHLSKYHGYTISDIKEDGFDIIHKISTVLANDDETSISSSYGLTVMKFAEFYKEHSFDIVFCLGDRFEMSAAVQAGIPFGIKYAHIHGGETTLGAIDNIYRHQITLASSWHFTTTEVYAQKVKELIGTKENVFSVGSLSLSEIAAVPMLEREEFFEKYNIPDNEYILTTFHPETIDSGHNKKYAKIMYEALESISSRINLVITMPNADTYGSLFRNELNLLHEAYPERIVLIENFGKSNYFSAIKYCKLLLGNSSSGIIEAASFGKYVVNVGERQKGRAQSKNIINAEFSVDQIVASVNKIYTKENFNGDNIYKKEGAVETIIQIIKG